MVDNLLRHKALGVILAGGAATRMGGGDKCLLPLGGSTLLARIVTRLQPQVAQILLSANGDPARFAGHEIDVVGDGETGQGPIAGLLTGLAQAQARALPFCLTVPGDAPLLPLDLAARLFENIGERACAVASVAEQRQSIFALWRSAALPDVRAAYDAGQRALWRLQDGIGAVAVPFAAETAASFHSVNRPEDLAALARTVARAGR